MGTEKFTPGPWRCACDSYGKVRHSKKKCVYTTITRPGGDELVNIAARIPNWGDAYLIAAAPDLYEALDNLMTALAHVVLYPDNALVDEMRAAEAALEKAEGISQ